MLSTLLASLSRRLPRLAGVAAVGAATLLAACGTTEHPNTAYTAYRKALAAPSAPVVPGTAPTPLSLAPSITLTGQSAPGAAPVESRALQPVDPLEAAARAEEAESGADAVGMPTDPLEPEKAVDLGSSEARSDLWARIRKGFAIADLDDDHVRSHERWYAARPEYVKRMTERSSRYLFHIVEEIERRGMPSELALLPFIESAFNPRAMSSAKASGMWQFIPGTGRTFDLKQNVFRDDRRDVLASTRAALDYLQRLNRMFGGDWQLALAAYNWGEGNVLRAIKRNERAGLPTDYASLKMPAETRHYVPKLQAVKNIVNDPRAYDLALPEIENHPYFVSVPIQRDIDATLAARLAGLSLDEFQDLNPSLNKPVILAAGTPQVLLPFENAEQFVGNLKAHKGRLASWTAWTVPKTMRPAEAARRIGMSESELRSINRIPPKMLVKAGSTLLVPRSQQHETDVAESVADNAVISFAPDQPPMRRVFVRAGKRDTVASLAKRHRVSAAQLAQWNRLSPGSRLAAGQKLALYKPVKAGPASTRIAKGSKPSSRAAAAARNKGKGAKIASRAAGKAGKAKSKGSRVASLN